MGGAGIGGRPGTSARGQASAAWSVPKRIIARRQCPMTGLDTRLAYFWGEDAWAIDRAIRDLAARLGEEDTPLDVWRADAVDEASGDGGASTARRRDRLIAEIEQRLGTAPLFGGGTLVVVPQPETLAREAAARARLMALMSEVPPGNGLALTELVSEGGRTKPRGGGLRDAVAAAGGLVEEFSVPTRQRMEAWATERARELDVSLGPGAAHLLAERVGAFVRETDIDRRRQTELADSELQRLALLRPDGTVTREDVAESVPEAVPGSTWAFLDAVGARRPRDAALLAERLLADGVPPPLLLAQLHRRIRELVVVREHLDEGSRGPALARRMKLQPFRAGKLEEQAARWTPDGLVRALALLLGLDLASKGITLDGSTRQMSDARTALALQQWVAETLVASG